MCDSIVAQIATQVFLQFILTQDIAGVSCKDDSYQGKKMQNRGPGRKSACVHWLSPGSMFSSGPKINLL